MYALATNLIGFRRSTLRVRIERAESGLVWVRTADLCDAGTPLVLNANQVTPLEETAEVGLRHKTGLLVMG